MYINIGANNGSEKLWGGNTTTSGKLIKAVYASYVCVHYSYYYYSIGTTAHCGLWPVEQCPSIFYYLPPTLSIFSLPALEDLFLLPLSILSWVFPFFSSLPVLE